MGPGKAFELFVKRILVNIGFSEVVSEGLYIYDGTPGPNDSRIGLGPQCRCIIWSRQSKLPSIQRQDFLSSAKTIGQRLALM